jgi:hypothetical protein
MLKNKIKKYNKKQPLSTLVNLSNNSMSKDENKKKSMKKMIRVNSG